MRIVEYGAEDLEGSLLLVAFNSRGLVGPIVSSYVIEQLSMWPVAALVDRRFPPTVVVRDGVGAPPVEFFVSAERCGPDGRCDQLLVMNAEIPLPPELAQEAARAVVAWAHGRGVRHVVTVEGFEFEGSRDADSEGEGGVLRAVAGANETLTLDAVGVPALPDGMITSHASAFLLAGRELGVEIVSVFAEAEEELDAAAAAQVLGRIDPLLPNLDLGSDGFMERVEAQGEERRRRSRDQVRQVKELQRSYRMMYQ
jgi:predicted ATP-grasp superfamily ATP-dependent carboligase